FLLQQHGLRASEVVFIDDHLPNVEAAKTLGFDVIHFTAAARLREGLVERGLLDNDASHQQPELL
ncbi:MAG: hypothetical protein P8X82_10830, partial [Gemmatimonadales bacterium]